MDKVKEKVSKGETVRYEINCSSLNLNGLSTVNPNRLESVISFYLIVMFKLLVYSHWCFKL